MILYSPAVVSIWRERVQSLVNCAIDYFLDSFTTSGQSLIGLPVAAGRAAPESYEIGGQ
jgi:hypothetical protein